MCTLGVGAAGARTSSPSFVLFSISSARRARSGVNFVPLLRRLLTFRLRLVPRHSRSSDYPERGPCSPDLVRRDVRDAGAEGERPCRSYARCLSAPAIFHYSCSSFGSGPRSGPSISITDQLVRLFPSIATVAQSRRASKSTVKLNDCRH